MIYRNKSYRLIPKACQIWLYLIGSGFAHSCASAIAIDLANCSASLQNYFENGWFPYFIAEFNAVLWCASAISGRWSFKFRYNVSSHFVRQLVECCMKRLTFGYIGDMPPVVMCVIPWYRVITLWLTSSTNSLASSLTNNKWNHLPIRKKPKRRFSYK